MSLISNEEATDINTINKIGTNAHYYGLHNRS